MAFQMLQYVEENPDPTIAAISSGLVLLAILALILGDRLVGLRKLADFELEWPMKILVANPNTSDRCHRPPGRLGQARRQPRHRADPDDCAARRALHRHARRGGDRQRRDARDAGRDARHLRCRDRRGVRRSRPGRRARAVRLPGGRHGGGGDAGRLHARPHLRHRELRQVARAVVRRDRRLARPVGPLRRDPHARRGLPSIDDVQDEKEQLLVDLANRTVTNTAPTW